MTVSSFFKHAVLHISLILLVMMSVFLIPVTTYAENSIALKVEVVSAEPGAEIQIPISITGNSGLASLKFNVIYDEKVLTLNSVTFPKRNGTYTSVPEPYSSVQTINFVSPLSLFTGTGTFATLSFTVSEEAETNINSTITIGFDEDDIFDMVFNNLPLSASNGSVRISDGIQGTMAVLPQSMTVIAEESFMNTSFYYVVLPDTVTTIEAKAFADCNDLKYIYIPENTTRIAENAFLHVTGLTIYGEDGSYAEFFANKYGYEFQTQ